jgi:F0F1-type ATP synthase assembly protein I
MATNVASASSTQSAIFSASRWTRGNHIFPTRIVVTPLHVSRVKSHMFGTTEESIAISQVASVEIKTGVIWSEIRIDSTGGAEPITSHGHSKGDAIRIREMIETYQARRDSGSK